MNKPVSNWQSLIDKVFGSSEKSQLKDELTSMATEAKAKDDQIEEKDNLIAEQASTIEKMQSTLGKYEKLFASTEEKFKAFEQRENELNAQLEASQKATKDAQAKSNNLEGEVDRMSKEPVDTPIVAESSEDVADGEVDVPKKSYEVAPWNQ